MFLSVFYTLINFFELLQSFHTALSHISERERQWKGTEAVGCANVRQGGILRKRKCFTAPFMVYFFLLWLVFPFMAVLSIYGISSSVTLGTYFPPVFLHCYIQFATVCTFTQHYPDKF